MAVFHLLSGAREKNHRGNSRSLAQQYEAEREEAKQLGYPGGWHSQRPIKAGAASSA